MDNSEIVWIQERLGDPFTGTPSNGFDWANDDHLVKTPKCGHMPIPDYLCAIVKSEVELVIYDYLDSF